jgi:hypothetical protein
MLMKFDLYILRFISVVHFWSAYQVDELRARPGGRAQTGRSACYTAKNRFQWLLIVGTTLNENYFPKTLIGEIHGLFVLRETNSLTKFKGAGILLIQSRKLQHSF